MPYFYINIIFSSSSSRYRGRTRRCLRHWCSHSTGTAYSLSFCSTGAQLLQFIGCRVSGDVSGQVFTLNSCPAGQVISIKSASIGYDSQWRPDVNAPTCSLQNAYCWLSITTHGSITKCNGQRSCSISQSIFTFTQKWCGGQYQVDLNNILHIIYRCTPGT